MSDTTARPAQPQPAMRDLRAVAALTATASLLLLSACGGGGGGADGTNNGGAQPVQLGQNLNGQPADNTIRCVDGAPAQAPAFQGFFFIPPANVSTSCTLITFFDGAQVPSTGIVVSANIKVGPVTGPMRFVRARVLFQRALPQDITSCCSVVEVGQTFTPAPNSITTVPLNFAMTHDRIPAALDARPAAQDLVAIEVLAPNVPIPGTWANPPFGGNFLQANYIYWPAFTLNPNNTGQNKLSDRGFSGFMPSYNLNFVPSAVAGRIVEP